MNFRRFQKAAAVAMAACGVVPAAFAQLVVGQTTDLSGPAAVSVRELNLGASLYLDEVNARGGVHGQLIRLVRLDDRNDPTRSQANARQLIVEQRALVLFLSRGTPQTQALLPLLAEHRVGLVAPSSGAMALRRPVHPQVFNVRASYQRESERAIHHLHTLGLKRIAVLRVDDSFGEDAALGASKGFAAWKSEAVVVEKFDRARLDYEGAVQRIVRADAQAVLLIGSGEAVAGAARLLRQAGSRAQLVTLSNNASTGFIRQLGDMAHGMIVTQVFPSERALGVAMVRQASDLARARGGDVELSPAMMEGFVAAKVLVEGLQRAGPAPTRKKVIDAFNTMDKFDIGGLEIGYSSADHTGIDHVDLSIITSHGKFMR